ncbi:unnamed protein product [Cunninghamella blakesleeana]
MTCENSSSFEGFEVSGSPFESFNYYPYIQHNDTGKPCFTIPRSNELESYAHYTESQAFNIKDLDLIGNCSRLSYCDISTKTCLPKRNLGSTCEYNMQCLFGREGLPGHCSNESICVIPNDLPPFFGYDNMTVGKYWKAATVAVIATGALVACILIGRHQAGKLVSGVSGLIEKWQNRDDHHYLNHSNNNNDSSATEPMLVATTDEELWHQQHSNKSWWYSIPGMKWLVYNLSQHGNNNRDPVTYVPLDNRPSQPPPYRDD